MGSPAAARLASLRGANLRELHTKGTCPPVKDLHGAIDGVALNGRLGAPFIRELGLWRGKVFDRDEYGTVTGLNRLGVGPIEIRRYRFTARVTRRCSATATSSSSTTTGRRKPVQGPELPRRARRDRARPLPRHVVLPNWRGPQVPLPLRPCPSLRGLVRQADIGH